MRGKMNNKTKLKEISTTHSHFKMKKRRPKDGTNHKKNNLNLWVNK